MKLDSCDLEAIVAKCKAHKQFFIDSYGGNFSSMPKDIKARCDEIDTCISEIYNTAKKKTNYRIRIDINYEAVGMELPSRKQILEDVEQLLHSSDILSSYGYDYMIRVEETE